MTEINISPREFKLLQEQGCIIFGYDDGEPVANYYYHPSFSKDWVRAIKASNGIKVKTTFNSLSIDEMPEHLKEDAEKIIKTAKFR